MGEYSGRRIACANGLRQELAWHAQGTEDGQCDQSRVSKGGVRLTGSRGPDGIRSCRLL